MEWHLWLTYVAVITAVALAPGTAVALSVSHGLSYGFRPSMATVAGLQLGVSILLLLGGLGVGAVVVASKTGFSMLKVAGVAYLFWLAWQQLRTPSAMLGSSDLPVATGLSARQRFMQGVLANLSNPAGLAFIVALLPSFIRLEQALALQLGVLLATTVVVDASVMAAYAALASGARRWLASPRAQRVQHRVMAGVFLSMGLALALMAWQN